MAKGNGLLLTILILAGLSVLLSCATLAYKPVDIQTEVVEVLVSAECEECICENEYVLTKSDFEEKATENKALELALNSVTLDNRDFKKSLFDALVLFGESIDSYKDITEISFEYSVDEDEVEFTKVKVYYFIDSDEDEDFKAKLDDFTVTIDDLEFDDNFEDAEVDEDYFDDLVVNKVY